MIGAQIVKEGTVKNTLNMVILTICFDGYGKKLMNHREKRKPNWTDTKGNNWKLTELKLNGAYT